MRYCYAFLIALTLWVGAGTVRAEYVSTEAIHHALIALPVAVADRKDSYKPQQLKTIAIAIQAATESARWPDNQRATMAALLVTVGYFESRYALRIHDWNPKRYSYSYGIFQVTPQAHGVQRHELVGLTIAQTTRAATIAAGVLSKSRQCGDTPHGWFTAYYGGVKCGVPWRTLEARTNTFWYVRALIVKYDREHLQ